MGHYDACYEDEADRHRKEREDRMRKGVRDSADTLTYRQLQTVSRVVADPDRYAVLFSFLST